MSPQKKYCVNCFVVMEWEAVCCPRCTFPQPINLNPMYLQAPHRLHHQYVVGRVLGHGSFGITYLAYDRSLGVKVAVKEYFPSEYAARNPHDMSIVPHGGEKNALFLSGKRKFIAEARLLSTLRSPYIIRIRHFFEEGNTAYFVMEYLEGQTLKEYLTGHGGKVDFETLRPILNALLDALEEVHSHNTYHRDIKPDNVYMTVQNKPILLDFGSARQQSASSTSTTISLLTPGFAPIEQYSPHGVQGPWTDIYGIASTVYYGLTGFPPAFPQDRLTGDAKLVSPIKLGSKLRPEDEAWLFKGLELRWNDRPSSIAEWRRQMPAPPQTTRQPVKGLSDGDENFIRFAILPKLANRFLTPDDEAEITESAAFLGINQDQALKLIERALAMTGSIRRNPEQEREAAQAKRAELENRFQEEAMRQNRLTFSEIFQPKPLFGPDGELPEQISNSLQMEFVLIRPYAPGAGFRIPKPFAMGATQQRYSVTLTRPYYLLRYPVTQGQWEKVMGKNPSFYHDHPNLPVEQVSWQDCEDFIRRLNTLKEGHYRLPTEAEWEFACRGESKGVYSFGANAEELSKYAWYQSNSEGRTRPVGTRKRNSLGLGDMHGNVWEWVQDWYAEFTEGHVTDPQGPEQGSEKVLRGGCWMSDESQCQIGFRFHKPPQTRSFQVGFRILLEAQQPT